MLTTLIESHPTRAPLGGGTAASILAHGMIITAMVLGTLPDVRRAVRDRIEPQKVMFVAPRTPAPAAPAPAGPAPSRAPAVPQLPTIAAPRIVPTSIPEPAPATTVVPVDQLAIGATAAPAVSSPGSGTMASGTSVGGAGDVIDANLADVAPHILGRAPQPRFPESLRAAGVTGRVLVQFVVDTLGHAESDGVSIVEATHPAFAEAVRSVLPKFRFQPGEAAGRRVRTMVMLPFNFTLR